MFSFSQRRKLDHLKRQVEAGTYRPSADAIVERAQRGHIRYFFPFPCPFCGETVWEHLHLSRRGVTYWQQCSGHECGHQEQRIHRTWLRFIGFCLGQVLLYAGLLAAIILCYSFAVVMLGD